MPHAPCMRLRTRSWCSLPQTNTAGIRSTDDREKFDKALKKMGNLYASMTATAVLQLQNMAPMLSPALDVSPALEAFRGVLVVNIPPGELASAAHARQLLRWLEGRGGEGAHIIAMKADLSVEFEDEDAAVRALSAMEGNLPERAVHRQDRKKYLLRETFDLPKAVASLLDNPELKTVLPEIDKVLAGELWVRFETAEQAGMAESALERERPNFAPRPLYNERPYAQRGWVSRHSISSQTRSEPPCLCVRRETMLPLSISCGVLVSLPSRLVAQCSPKLIWTTSRRLMTAWRSQGKPSFRLPSSSKAS